jgi:hypothetical protein
MAFSIPENIQSLVMKKKYSLILAGVVVLAFGVWISQPSDIDPAVKETIEEVGTTVAKTHVQLDDVSISLTTGEGTVKGLTIGNPEGFTAAQSLSAGTISVKLNPSSVNRKGPVIIRQIVIDKPTINLESRATGDTNLQALVENLQAGRKAAHDKTGKKKHKKKFIINNLYVRDGQIDISHPKLQQHLTAALPAIHLANIGRKRGGVTSEQLGRGLLKLIAMKAGTVGEETLAQHLGEPPKEAAGESTKAAKEHVEKAPTQ